MLVNFSRLHYGQCVLQKDTAMETTPTQDLTVTQAQNAPARGAEILSSEKIREEQAYTLGTAAYLWGFTMNELYRVRSAALAKPGNAINKFEHVRALMTPELARKVGVVRANSATLYSAAWLDLSVEPVVIELPPIADRYFTFNYVDYFQNNQNLSNVTIGRAGGAYAFIGPNWRGILPDKVHRVNVASDTVWIIGRTEVKGPDDVKNVNALQDLYSLTSLREWVAGRRNTCGDNAYPKWPAYDVSKPLNFFALLNEGLKHNPPQGADLAILGMFETLNIGPNKSFDAARLDPATAAGLKRALEVGPQLLAADFKARVGQVINGWNFTSNLGSWRTPDTDQLDFLLRSAIAKEAQPGQNPSEAVYPFTFNDVDGKPLTGANRYVARFVKGNLPPVNAFWSVTLYDATGFVVENPIHRNQIGTYDNLKPDADGSVPIYIQRDSPGKDKEGNWLPSPDGLFNLALRLYNPGPAALTMDWTPPPVTQAK